MEIVQRVRRLWWAALAIGAGSMALALLWVLSPGGPSDKVVLTVFP